MQKKDFSFKYNINTKTGKMHFDNKYINLDTNKKEIGVSAFSPCSGSFFSSSSGIGGYGLNLIREKK